MIACSPTTHRHVTRRHVLPAGAVIGTATFAAACGTSSQPPSAQPSGLSQEAATVSFLGRGNVTNQQTFDELSKRFMQQNPKVTVEFTPVVQGDFDEKYQVLNSGGTAPDVAFAIVATYKSHIARGVAAPLDELAKRDKSFKEADYDSYWLEALRYKGKLVGMPWDPGMVALHFNRSIFEKAGVKFPDATTPMTWEDTLDVAKRLTKDTGGHADVFGLELWWNHMWWQLPRQMGLADVYQGEEHVLKLDHPIAIDALQWIADLRVKHKVSRPTTGYSGPATDFPTGKLAMFTTGVWDAANNRRNLQDDWDWAPLPQFKGKKRIAVGQASPFILGAASKAKDQAWQLMRFLAGPVGQELALSTGTSQPMLKAQHTAPAFAKLNPPRTPHVVIEETKHAMVPPYGPSYIDIQAVLSKVLAPVYTGEQSARQAITAAAPELKRIMGEAKRRYG